MICAVQQAGNQLAALADPTREQIFRLIRRAPSSVRELTDRVDISQPAVSQHLKVLREASLVIVTPRGASNIYSVNPAGVETLRNWIEELWDDVLDRFVEAAAGQGEEPTS